MLDGNGKEGRGSRGVPGRAAPTARYEHVQTRSQGWALIILRVATVMVFLLSGGQKLIGGGLSTVSEGLGEHQVPSALPVATAVSLVEFLGGAALVLGLFTR